jgi:transcriptional regulator with XRE-family HTH domain
VPRSPQRPEGTYMTPPGGRIFERILETNVRALRRRGRMSQEGLAERMRELGHPTWTSSAVSEIERGGRSVSTSELYALALAFGAEILDLLDPRGIDGSETAPVGYGDYWDPEAYLPVDVVSPWVRGEISLQFTGPGSVWLRPVPGHEDAFQRASDAFAQWKSERLRAIKEAIAAGEETEKET